MKKITLILLFICSLVKAQITSLDNWKTKGNTFSTSTNYLGTNNAQSLVLKTNSLTAVTIETNQAVNTSTNLNVGGSFSVNGTSTLTGIVTTSSITSTGNLDLGAATGSVVSLKGGTSNILQATTSSLFISPKTRIGSFTAPSATLDVTGTMSVSSTATLASTLKLGSSAVLTGGNTGTVAVLSDAVFPVQLSQAFHSPVDATTYYFGSFSDVASSNAATNIVYLPYNCTLVGWTFNGRVQTTPSSAETSTLNIRVDNTTDVLLSSSITFSLASGFNNYTASGLSTNFNAGSYINAKLVSPSWATNPTNVGYGLTLWFVRRQ